MLTPSYKLIFFDPINTMLENSLSLMQLIAVSTESNRIIREKQVITSM